MTFVPSDSNWPWTNRPALCPIETMVVTAAIPITTPRTVSEALSLFFNRARIAMRNVSINVINNLAVTASVLILGPFNSQLFLLADNERNTFDKISFEQLGESVVG